MPTRHAPPEAAALVFEIEAYIDRALASQGGDATAEKPGHRVKFHWPPHPVSYEFQVLATEWTGHASFLAHGETFDVRIARTPYGVFGRCEAIWHEDRGATVDDMLANLRRSSEPLFARQISIASTLERPGRFTGHISELGPSDLLKLLYCRDRDVASEARSLIEAQASSRLFLPALLAILGDRKHAFRRSAQWCVLDLFEDLPSFCSHEDEELAAIGAIKSLIWDAEDDYARTIYKAGVVLGGHVPGRLGGPALMECLYAPSKIGRRSAIHGVFHVVEWEPSTLGIVTSALRQVAEVDPEPLLRDFARQMALDIEIGDMDHVQEPVFPEEAG